MIKFEVIKGELLEHKVDAIVRPSNQNLSPVGGVAERIDESAGLNLKKECGELGGCSTGKSKITMSYNLETYGIGWVIHTVGPRYVGGMYFEEDLLADAYQSALELTLTYEKVYKSQCLEVLNKYVGHLDSSTKNAYILDTKNELSDYCEAYPIKSIGLPPISTGAYGYPIDEAAKIAIKSIKAFCKANDHLEYVLLICEDQVTYNTFKKLM